MRTYVLWNIQNFYLNINKVALYICTHLFHVFCQLHIPHIVINEKLRIYFVKLNCVYPFIELHRFNEISQLGIMEIFLIKCVSNFAIVLSHTSMCDVGTQLCYEK